MIRFSHRSNHTAYNLSFAMAFDLRYAIRRPAEKGMVSCITYFRTQPRGSVSQKIGSGKYQYEWVACKHPDSDSTYIACRAGWTEQDPSLDAILVHKGLYSIRAGRFLKSQTME